MPQDGIIEVSGNSGSVTIGGPSGTNGQGFTFQNAPTNEYSGDINLIAIVGIDAPVVVQNNILIGLNGANNPFDTGILAESTPAGSPITVNSNTFEEMWQGILFQQTVGSGTIENNTFKNLVPSTDTTVSPAHVYEPEAIFALTFGGLADNVSNLAINSNNFSDFNGLAITVAGGYTGYTPSQFTDVTIDDNNISSIGFDPDTFRAGILLINYGNSSSDESQGGVVNATIDGNTLEAQTACAAGSVGVALLGVNTNLTIDNNLVENLDYGIYLAEQVTGAGYSSAVKVNDNSFTGNTYGIYNPSPNLIDAGYNYWGSADSTTVKAQASGGFETDYNPYLGNGTNTTSASTGFVPVAQVPYTDAVQISGNDSVQANSPYTLTFNLTSDPNLGTINQGTINWGDGSTPTVVTSPTATHTYTPTSQTTYSISATVMNTGGQSFQVANTVAVTATVVSTLVVTTFTPTVSGFHARFNHAISTSALSLYTNPTAPSPAPSDVTVVGPNGPVKGSLKLDADSQGFTFVATGAPLAEQAAGNYTVTILGTSGGVQQSSNNALLDGTGSGTPGSNYVTTFNVASNSGPFLTIPDFARGPGQPVNVPATGTGLPIQISDGTNVNSAMFVLTYDPTLLTIAGASLASGLPAGTQIVTNDSIPGRLAICVTLPVGDTLSPGLQTLVELNASVPLSNNPNQANAPYLSKEVLNLQVVDINGIAATGQGDQSLDVVDYLGDAAGQGYYVSQDATLIQRVILSPLSNAGFGAFPLVDPTIIGDIEGVGYLVSQDANLIQRYLLSQPTPQIPTYTGPPTALNSGPDPEVYLSRGLAGLPGASLQVPVELFQSNKASINLQSFNLVISYDPSTFSVTGFQSGSLTSGFQLTERVDAADGLIFISGSSSQSLTISPGTLGDLVRIDLSVLANAKTGSYELNLLGNSGTSITSLNDGGLTLAPAPTNAGNDPVDGMVTIGSPWTTSPFRPGHSPVVFPVPTTNTTLVPTTQTSGATPSPDKRNGTPPTPASQVISSPTPASQVISSPTPASQVISSPSPASQVISSPSVPQLTSHDLAIEALTSNPEVGSGSPGYLIPLTIDGGSDNSSDSANVSETNPTSAKGVANSPVRVAFRHRALTHIVATTDPNS